VAQRELGGGEKSRRKFLRYSLRASELMWSANCAVFGQQPQTLPSGSSRANLAVRFFGDPDIHEAVSGRFWEKSHAVRSCLVNLSAGLFAEFGPASENLYQCSSSFTHSIQFEVFFFFLVFAQRARIAFWAISRRCSGVSFSCRAFAPRRPRATALGFFSFLSDIGQVQT
jgi:hypothetical protein